MTMLTGELGVTPLHLLLFNQNATDEMIQLLVDAYPQLVLMAVIIVTDYKGLVCETIIPSQFTSASNDQKRMFLLVLYVPGSTVSITLQLMNALVVVLFV